MKIALGTDHAGFPLKQLVEEIIVQEGHEILDFGTHSEEPVDYPDYSLAVGRAIIQGEADRGIVLCGSGVGASIAANKIMGIRAAICHDLYTAKQAVEHNDMNVLCLGARVIGKEKARDIVKLFLTAQFAEHEPRHVRRLAKVSKIEHSAIGIGPAKNV